MAVPCKGCGAPIDWVRTDSGSLIPVNQEYVTIDPAGPKNTGVVTDEGRVVLGSKVDEDALFNEGRGTVRGRITHFATCPKSRDFRKRK